MLIILTARYLPKYETISDLRTVLFNWATAQQNAGRQISLHGNVWAPEGVWFEISTVYESVAEAWFLRNVPASPQSPTRHSIPPSAATAPFVEYSPGWLLYEIISRPEVVTAANLAMELYVHPAYGKASELKTALVDWVGVRQSQENQMSLLERVFGPEGPEFKLRIGYESQAEAEDPRTGLVGEVFRDITNEFGALIDKPPYHRMVEIPIPWTTI